MKRLALFALSPFLLLPIAQAQTAPNNCPAQPPSGAAAIAPNTTTYYQLDSSIGQNMTPGVGVPSPTDQITQAIFNWNYAESGLGGSGANLAPADATHPASVTFQASPTPPVTPEGVDLYTIGVMQSASGVLGPGNEAFIVLYPNSFITGTSQSAFAATAPSYGTMITQVAAHEIGHLMGLGDYPSPPPDPAPNTSVVNPTHGQNDINDPYQKLGPTQCDIAQAYSVQHKLYAIQQKANRPPNDDPGQPLLRYTYPNSISFLEEDWYNQLFTFITVTIHY